MRVLKALGVVVLLIILAVLVMVLMGSRLPHAHTASASAVVNAPPERVWQLITDSAAQPTWRSGLKSVVPLPSRDGHPCWQENSMVGKMPLCEVAASAPTLRIVRISDPALPFGGGWTYRLTPLASAATRLDITENGTTGPAFWRFFGHFVFHEDTMIKQYEHDLQQRVARTP